MHARLRHPLRGCAEKVILYVKQGVLNSSPAKSNEKYHSSDTMTTSATANTPMASTTRKSRPQFHSRPSSSSSLVYQVRQDCTATLGLHNTVPLRKGDKVRASSPIDLGRSRAVLRSRSTSRLRTEFQAEAPQQPSSRTLYHINDTSTVKTKDGVSPKPESGQNLGAEESMEATEKCFVIHLRTGLPVWINSEELTYPNGVWVSPASSERKAEG